MKNNVELEEALKLLEKKVDTILERLELEPTTIPEVNTVKEWKEFGNMWMDGRGDELEWMDLSKDGDRKWHDMEYDDCWYPYDTKLVYRRK